MHILQVIRDYYANAYWIKSFTTQKCSQLWKRCMKERMKDMFIKDLDRLSEPSPSLTCI